MNCYPYKNLTIVISDETTYTFVSSDNNFCYSKHYFVTRYGIYNKTDQ